MPRRPTAKRYALAAFEIARDLGQIESWAQDIQTAREALQDTALKEYLELPKVSTERKLRSLQSAMNRTNPLVVNLLALLISRGSLGLLPGIVKEYQRLTDAHFNRERAEVVTAVALDDQQSARLSQQLTNLLGKEILLTNRVDPDVLGGLVAHVGDSIIDGSTRGRLMALRMSLKDTPL